MTVHGKPRAPNANKLGKRTIGTRTSGASCLAPPTQGIRILSMNVITTRSQPDLLLLRRQQKLQEGSQED